MLRMLRVPERQASTCSATASTCAASTRTGPIPARTAAAAGVVRRRARRHRRAASSAGWCGRRATARSSTPRPGSGPLAPNVQGGRRRAERAGQGGRASPRWTSRRAERDGGRHVPRDARRPRGALRRDGHRRARLVPRRASRARRWRRPRWASRSSSPTCAGAARWSTTGSPGCWCPSATRGALADAVAAIAADHARRAAMGAAGRAKAARDFDERKSVEITLERVRAAARPAAGGDRVTVRGWRPTPTRARLAELHATPDHRGVPASLGLGVPRTGSTGASSGRTTRSPTSRLERPGRPRRRLRGRDREHSGSSTSRSRCTTGSSPG